MAELAYLVQTAAAIWMCAVIWLVQLLHYPSFYFVAAERFAEFERFHCLRISPVVMPAMLLEAVALGTYLLLRPEWGVVDILSLLLLLLIWSSTFLLQTPLHARLERGFDAEAIARLIRSNWLRTFAWTARVLLLLFFAPKLGGFLT